MRSKSKLISTSVYIEYVFSWYSYVALAFLWDKRPSRDSHVARGIWKRRFHFKNRIKFFPSTIRRRTKTGFVFKQNFVREIPWMSWCHRFRKDPFSKCFPSTIKQKGGDFKFGRFKTVYKTHRGRLVWMVDQTREIQLHFHISPAPSDFLEMLLFKLNDLATTIINSTENQTLFVC